MAGLPEDTWEVTGMVASRLLPHPGAGTVTAEGSRDVALAFLALPWTAVTCPGISSIASNNSQSTRGQEGGPQKVLLNLLQLRLQVEMENEKCNSLFSPIMPRKQAPSLSEFSRPAKD